MTASEFFTWAADQPGRFELIGGEVVAMAPERSLHALTKARVWRQLDDAIRTLGLPCTAYPDGMALRIDEATVYEPDAQVRRGDRLADDALEVRDPMVVVEVLSATTRTRDAGAKLADHFRLATLHHYLIVDATRRVVIHHRRTQADVIETMVRRDSATVSLHPPGIELSVERLFP